MAKIKDVLLKVMLVDDEENIRNILKLCIDWKEFEMEIAAEASSGREALDMMEGINLDIIICDIKMPYMDGLEFSSIVIEQYPHIKVIIMTAYDEFTYAKRGIKLGVVDYLSKPVNRFELKKSLTNIKSKIKEEQLNRNEYNKLIERLNENLPYLKERFLNELMETSNTIEHIEDKLQFLSLDCLLKHIQVALLEPSICSNNQEGAQERKAILELECIETVKKFFKEFEKVNVFNDNRQRIVILNSNKEIDFVKCCEQIKSLINNRIKCQVCIGIGNIYEGTRLVRKTYMEASEALKFKVVYGKNQIVCFNDININEVKDDMRIDEINELGFFIKAGITEKAVRINSRMFDELYINKNNSVHQIRVMSLNIVTIILNSITELGMNFEDIFGSKDIPYNNILKIDTIPEMKDYMNKLIEGVSKTISSARNKKNNRILKDITSYIRNNISNPELSLSGIACTFYLNSSYLSRIFKQEMGFTFIEYLTKMRIEKAMAFLKETDLLAYEVGERVGIPDPNYFGKCFKKFTGLSVNDYKKWLRHNQLPLKSPFL